MGLRLLRMRPGKSVFRMCFRLPAAARFDQLPALRKMLYSVFQTHLLPSGHRERGPRVEGFERCNPGFETRFPAVLREL